MAEIEHYAIRGGTEGRERLRIISRVLRPSTTSLLGRLGVGDGMTCLDVGCGGGDVTAEIASRVGPRGRAVGVDMDEAKLEIARREAEEQGIRNVEFRALDIRRQEAGSGFDLVYARFLLTHLDDPAEAVAAFRRHLRPGGLVVVEDIDFSGYFTYPECQAHRRYRELYCAVVRKRGGDPDIGPRLPSLLAEGGFDEVGVAVVQPVGTQGEVKLISPITMESIADVALSDGLASREEIDAVVRELYEFADNPQTLASLPRIVQAWGRRSVAEPL
ncbi:MAG TPA: methyltransferase domain-containing protein [Blastocatellia bacterium]|nr:methyltransferase domain-containing protein [Blastocatellia bacterium]